MTVQIGSQSDVPAPGDPIVSPWYQDTSRKLVHQFASKSALDAWAAADGSVGMIPPGILYVRRSGVWRLYDAFPVLTSSTNVAGSNCPQGITTLGGTLSVPSGPVNRVFTVWWHYALSGHSTGSEFRTRITTGGTPLAIDGYGHYQANESYINTTIFHLWREANTAGFPLEFQIEISTQFANTNVNGVAVMYGVATEATGV